MYLVVMLASAYFAVEGLLLLAQGCMTPDDLIHGLVLTEEHIREAFDALDIERDGLITEKDMEKLYWHSESEFARDKFLQMINSPLEKNREIDIKDLSVFIKKRPVTLAIYGCKYINSNSLRKFCFADQILAYVFLVLDKASVTAFFTSLESPKDSDQLICYEEISKIAELVPSFNEKDVDNFMLEIGKDDRRITREEFTEYVLQEDLHDNFRTCRKSIVGTKVTYNNTCLTIHLLDYTKNHITEMDIAIIFDIFDEDNDRLLKAHEIMKTSKCDPQVAERFITIMDRSKDASVSYGEFRYYVRSPNIKLHLERECSVKIDDPKEELECYKNKILELVEINHTPIWLFTPDLDMIFTFEDLDQNNDGRISVDEDLVFALRWDKELATKLVTDIDRRRDAHDVSLQEFNEYVDQPNMVYALTDCLDIDKGEERIKCYIKHFQAVVKGMMTKAQIDEFFEYYDKTKNGKITKKELEGTNDQKIDEDHLNYFVKAVGMGDDIITKREFIWFVRQPGLIEMFDTCKNLMEKHIAIVRYLEDMMTEYDVQNFFEELDKNHDEEVTESDFLRDPKKIKHLLERVDKDKDRTVNFIEFWLYLNSPIDNARKHSLEGDCPQTPTRKTNKDIMDCYKVEILKLKR